MFYLLLRAYAEVSPAMWELWPVMVNALQDWALQYFENVLVPMDNYISRGTETFLAHPTCQQDVLKLASMVLLNKEMPDPECLPAPKLLECVLQNCRGRVDDYVAPYLAVALERLAVCQLSYLKDLLIQVLANCLYYNPVLTLNVLTKNGRTTAVLATWFEMLSARQGLSDRPLVRHVYIFPRLHIYSFICDCLVIDYLIHFWRDF